MTPSKIARADHGRESGEENQNAGNSHDRALNQVRVNGGKHSPGHAIKHQHRAGDDHAGDKTGFGPEIRVDQDALQHRGHRQHLRCEVAHDTEQDCQGREATSCFAVIAGRNNVRQRDRIEYAGKQPQALSNREVANRICKRYGDQYPERARAQCIDQSRATNETESAHRAGEHCDPGHHDAEMAPGHEEVARRRRSTHRPDADTNA